MRPKQRVPNNNKHWGPLDTKPKGTSDLDAIWCPYTTGYSQEKKAVCQSCHSHGHSLSYLQGLTIFQQPALQTSWEAQRSNG